EASPAVTIAITPNSARRTRSAGLNWKLKTGGSTKKSRRRALTSVAATADLKPRNRETRKMAARNGLPTIGSNQCWASSSTTRAMPGAMIIHANVRMRHIPDLSTQRPCQRTNGTQATALGVQAGSAHVWLARRGRGACPAGALECIGFRALRRCPGPVAGGRSHPAGSAWRGRASARTGEALVPEAARWRTVELLGEFVALAVHGENVCQVVRVGLELLAEPEDVGVHGARGREALVPPHLVEEALTSEDLPPVLDEVAQQVELLAGQ